MILSGLLAATAVNAVAADGEHRGEISLQFGARWVDGELSGSDLSENVRPVFGIGTGWAISPKWNWFIDMNISRHNGLDLCENAIFCDWSTPTVKVQTLRSGMERRFRPNRKNAQWFVNAAPAWMDVELPGIQMHHNSISVGGGRRFIKTTGSLRVELRLESMLGSYSDEDLWGTSHLHIRAQNATVLVNWGWGWGSTIEWSD